jgi:4,5-DOPA dioxygenase extradiol
LIIASGDVVHNLRAMSRGNSAAYDWARRFNGKVREHLVSGNVEPLVDYEQ